MAKEAVAAIPDGATLMIGELHDRWARRVGSIDELARQGKRGLTVIANDTARPGVGVGKLIEPAREAGRFQAAWYRPGNANGRCWRVSWKCSYRILWPHSVERIRAGGHGLWGIL